MFNEAIHPSVFENAEAKLLTHGTSAGCTVSVEHQKIERREKEERGKRERVGESGRGERGQRHRQR